MFGVSGRVKTRESGKCLWSTIRELLMILQAVCRTVQFEGILPGGGSTDFMLPEHLDLALDYDEISQKGGSRLATGTMIVLDDQTCPVGMIGNPQFLPMSRVIFAHPRDGLLRMQYFGT